MGVLFVDRLAPEGSPQAAKGTPVNLEDTRVAVELPSTPLGLSRARSNATELPATPMALCRARTQDGFEPDLLDLPATPRALCRATTLDGFEPEALEVEDPDCEPPATDRPPAELGAAERSQYRSAPRFFVGATPEEEHLVSESESSDQVELSPLPGASDTPLALCCERTSGVPDTPMALCRERTFPDTPMALCRERTHDGFEPFSAEELENMPVCLEQLTNSLMPGWSEHQMPVDWTPDPNGVCVVAAPQPQAVWPAAAVLQVIPASLPAPQPQAIQTVNSGGVSHISWTVDARKLESNDKQAVSPSFEFNLGPQFPPFVFKIMLYPTVMAMGKGGSSFSKAKGWGLVQLKCESELMPTVSFLVRFSVGAMPPRGPVAHSFSQSAVCGLPKDIDEWNFKEAVDRQSRTFTVNLELVPQLEMAE